MMARHIGREAVGAPTDGPRLRELDGMKQMEIEKVCLAKHRDV